MVLYTQGTGFCGYLALTQIEENNGLKLKMETASDRSKVIECCQRILKGCSENCNPEVIQQIRDTIILIVIVIVVVVIVIVFKLPTL